MRIRGKSGSSLGCKVVLEDPGFGRLGGARRAGAALIRGSSPTKHRVLDSAGVIGGEGKAEHRGRDRAGRVSGLRPHPASAAAAPPPPAHPCSASSPPRPRAASPLSHPLAAASLSLQRGVGKMAAQGGGAGDAGPGSGPSAGTAGEAAESALRPGEVAVLHPQEVAARLQRMRRELSNRRKILVKNLPQDSSSQVWALGRGDRARLGDTVIQRNPCWSQRPGEAGKEGRCSRRALELFASSKPFCLQRDSVLGN